MKTFVSILYLWKLCSLLIFFSTFKIFKLSNESINEWKIKYILFFIIFQLLKDTVFFHYCYYYLKIDMLFFNKTLKNQNMWICENRIFKNFCIIKFTIFKCIKFAFMFENFKPSFLLIFLKADIYSSSRQHHYFVLILNDFKTWANKSKSFSSFFS